MADTTELSIDQLFSLLRLYMDWPSHVTGGDDKEANEFYMWLAQELEEAELAEITGGLDGVKRFIRGNPDVLTRARYLKTQEPDALGRKELREDPRITVNTQLFFLVYDCEKEPSLTGSILHGLLVDIGRQGMRIETSRGVPAGAILNMTVAQTGSDVTLYNLTGEVRWSTEHSSASYLGVSVFNIEDFERWQNFYYSLSASY